jgi:predicted DNA-binding helix-hairpin-helix protein
VAARRVAEQRMAASIRGLGDLRKLGVITTRAGGFLTLRGRRLQTTRWTEQLGFWAPEDEAGMYHGVYQVSPGTFR